MDIPSNADFMFALFPNGYMPFIKWFTLGVISSFYLRWVGIKFIAEAFEGTDDKLIITKRFIKRPITTVLLAVALWSVFFPLLTIERYFMMWLASLVVYYGIIVICNRWLEEKAGF